MHEVEVAVCRPEVCLIGDEPQSSFRRVEEHCDDGVDCAPFAIPPAAAPRIVSQLFAMQVPCPTCAEVRECSFVVLLVVRRHYHSNFDFGAVSDLKFDFGERVRIEALIAD